MRQILKNSNRDKELNENGYAIFPFLTAELIAVLQTFLKENLNGDLEGLYATSHDSDAARRKNYNDFILSQIAPLLPGYFIDCQMLGATFMIKMKGKKGVLAPHQDWTIVDEANERSFNLWIPLVDVEPDNGTIQVIAGSHLWNKTFRGFNLPNPYGKASKYFSELLQPLTMKAGAALIYDHRLIHASGANQTSAPRTVLVCGILAKESSLQFLRREGNKILRFQASPEFYLYNNPEDVSGLQKIDSFDYAFSQFLHPHPSLGQKLKFRLGF